MEKKELNLSRNGGFTLPEEYFDDLETKILDKIEISEGESFLSDTGFIVPDQYFNALEDRILVKLDQKPSNKVIKLFSLKNITMATALAASFILMLMFNVTGEKEIELSDLETDVIENYIYDETSNSFDLAQLLDMDNDEISLNDLINLDESNLEDYIYDNLETEDIIE